MVIFTVFRAAFSLEQLSVKIIVDSPFVEQSSLELTVKYDLCRQVAQFHSRGMTMLRRQFIKLSLINSQPEILCIQIIVKL